MVALMEGRCLCGRVRISADRHKGGVSACHCSICRRWGGAATWGFEAPAEAVRVTGPARSYRSSPFAERAFCAECGTHLWFRQDGAAFELMPGLFEAAAALPLAREVYADRAMACVPLAGGHPRMSAAEYERAHPFVEGDAP